MSWEKIKLGNLYKVHNGLSKGRQFFGSGYPFLSFSTVFNNWFLPETLHDLVQSSESERESYSILRGDIFITRTSETMDELGMSSVALKDYPNATYNGFTKRLRPINNQCILPEFIGYYLRCNEFRKQFVAFSTMTTRASLRNEDLLSIAVPVPPITIQRRIADILSAYDGLIENNRKQIKLLEEAAQRLYKEWFVDLHFPGYEQTKIVDGVPEGWGKKSISSISSVLRRGISPKYNGQGIYTVINQKCIKGLATACWTLNTELFANVRDSKGQFKVVLLLRPDIFNSLNLQNATNKLADNAVYLEWRTTYTDYPTSNLYKMANKLLAYSQDNKKTDDIWEQYFNWELPTSNPDKRKNDTAFMEFLKISLSRPRDIQRILTLIREIMLEDGLGNAKTFDYNAYNSDRFQNAYSEYFLSSLKDQLSFYYSEEDYKHFRKFFDFFDDPQFTYEQYQNAYTKYVDYILDNAKEIPQFVEDPKAFMQLLYDSNVITAIEEGGKYFHFSYREKSPSNIAPEVPYGKNIKYRFHYGLYKKAKMGRFG